MLFVILHQICVCMRALWLSCQMRYSLVRMYGRIFWIISEQLQGNFEMWCVSKVTTIISTEWWCKITVYQSINVNSHKCHPALAGLQFDSVCNMAENHLHRTVSQRRPANWHVSCHIYICLYQHTTPRINFSRFSAKRFNKPHSMTWHVLHNICIQYNCTQKTNCCQQYIVCLQSVRTVMGLLSFLHHHRNITKNILHPDNINNNNQTPEPKKQSKKKYICRMYRLHCRRGYTFR